MDPVDPISPELVLVCPELRERPAARSTAALTPPSARRATEARARRDASLAASLPKAPLAVGVVAAIVYVVSAFT